MAESWKIRVAKRYAELKRLGKPFFPDIIFKDTVAVFVVFVAMVSMAAFVGTHLEGVANPADSTYNPRPEWYFLFLFQALKLFPGSLEALAAVVLPGLFMCALIVLPFLDRGSKRHPLDRPFVTGCGILVCVVVGWLTIQGLRSPLLNPVVEKDPQVLAGMRLYRELRCQYCHSIDGQGGLVAPDLTTVGARRDRAWLLLHLEDPTKAVAGSLMPQLHLLPDELEGLTAYLQTLGGDGPFTAEAPALFDHQCRGCHMLDGKGGELGPDLTAIRSYRDKAYIQTYMANPAALNPETTMPGFLDLLTEAQIEDIARYLASVARGGAAK